MAGPSDPEMQGIGTLIDRLSLDSSVGLAKAHSDMVWLTNR